MARALKGSNALTGETIYMEQAVANGSDVVETSGCGTGACSSQRRLTVDYPFFDVPPYINLGAVGGAQFIVDSSGDFCTQSYQTPAIIEPEGVAGFPQDATSELVQANMACGIAPIKFVFTTSALSAYNDTTETASMQIVITLAESTFIDSDYCESVLYATGGFPRLSSCLFVGKEATLTLQTPLTQQQTYSIAIKVVSPAVRKTASENNFGMVIKLQGKDTIEGTIAPVDMVDVVESAKDTSHHGGIYDYDEGRWDRGYITALLWQPDSEYSPYMGSYTKFSFGLRSFGEMTLSHLIQVVAYPTNVWRFGEPDSDCDNYQQSGLVGSSCKYWSFPGALETESNGFQITVGTTPFLNLGTDTAVSFSMLLQNPSVPVNAYWVATSFRYDNLEPVEPFSVFMDKPVAIIGSLSGYVTGWELAAVSQIQWITLELYPGNMVMPVRVGDESSTGGMLVFVPPTTFVVLSNEEPADVPGYNALPCRNWPEADREAGRWVCKLEDEVPFADTPYRVQFKVQNPASPGAALAWRVELWQQGDTKPVALTRQIRGMPVSGTMAAALAPSNQMLGASNVIKFDFTPSQDIGDYVETRLEVVAPEGFVIKKTPSNFELIDIPDCTVAGSDSNSFSLTFTESNVIRAGEQYVFALEVSNPQVVVPDNINYWNFETVRPDGFGRDTARYAGFDMYPAEFLSYKVEPMSRYAGAQYVVVKFTSSQTIPADDFIRVRAPVGVNWYTEDLDFATNAAVTGSQDLGTGTPVIGFADTNELIFQLTSAALGNLEYGFRCRIEVPEATPVPNRWWIEQFRGTGSVSTATWSNIAAMGVDGFTTSALINVAVTPFSVVKEGWNNPTFFVFEAATAVAAGELQLASSTQVIPADLFVVAPPSFTYICPLEETLAHYLEAEGAVSVPDDVECNLVYDPVSRSEILRLSFNSGIEAGVKYAFTVDIVNAPFIDPTDNSFTLETRYNGQFVESLTVDGYQLADRMDNTRYYPYPASEDRKALATANVVTFIIGLSEAIDEATVLEVKAPFGYHIAYDCTLDFGQATWVTGMIDLPAHDTCQNREAVSPEMDYIADIYMTGYWGLGEHALWISVGNPQFDSERNYWSFTIRDSVDLPLASEPWVEGFKIQAVYNAAFTPYIPANTISGEAAINPVELSFELTTPLPASTSIQAVILIQAPEGFLFPPVCQDFVPDTGNAASGMFPLPSSTSCRGDGGRHLTLTLPSWFEMVNSTSYQVRFTVINPTYTFVAADTADRWWQIQTQYNGEEVDKNTVVPSFPVYQRLQYFSVDTLSQIGDEATSIRVLFQLDSELSPQKTVTITGPEGMAFGGVQSYYCVDPDVDLAIISSQFAEPAISGVIPLPEWMECHVEGTSVKLTNAESVLDGRSLETIQVFEFFVQNVTNPPSVPDVNNFFIVAETDTEFGQEAWATDAWELFPQLTDCSVTSSNPSYSLYTNFTFSLGTVTSVPAGGSIQIVGPGDYYFGPILGYVDDLLESIPPSQGMVDERPSNSQLVACSLLRPADWVCVLDFQPCVDQASLESIGSLISTDEQALLDAATLSCEAWQTKCNSGDLSELITCESQSNVLTLTLQPDVMLPSGRFFRIAVPGHNTRYEPTEDDDVTWTFRTRDSDVDQTVMDERVGVTGLTLVRVVDVLSISPYDTKVSSSTNVVTVTIRLDQTIEPYARLLITYPEAYALIDGAADQGLTVSVATDWPTKTINIVQYSNVVELTSYEEAMPANTDMTFDVILSNPAISPFAVDNIWMFEALSRANSDTFYTVSSHLHVHGFKVFGEFSVSTIEPTIMSPTATNQVNLYFMLKSPLVYTASSYLWVWLPVSWAPNTYVAPGSTDTNWWQELADPQLLSGTEASAHYDEALDQYYILFRLGTTAEAGIQYAFGFNTFNPPVNPTDTTNEWRLETSQNGVMLHLQSGIEGFFLQELVTASVTPSDTTSLLEHNKVSFKFESNQRIVGGSLITILAPEGFIFDCYDPLALFETEGLAATTTCSDFPLQPNLVELTMDSLDVRLPNAPFTITISMTNPEFTPQVNYFTFSINDPAGAFTDMANNVPSYDITGDIDVVINGTFPYFGYTNPLVIEFQQTTILNMADTGNEIVLTGPTGYVFPVNCTGFDLRFSLETAAQSVNGYSDLFVFPPPGIECTGFGNSTVVIKLPEGVGLLTNLYTLNVDVEDPLVGGLNCTDECYWTLLTRIRNDDGQHIVDSRINIEANFELNVLAAMAIDEGGAGHLAAPGLAALAAGALSLLLASGDAGSR